MEDFSVFIKELNFFEFSLGGRKFTWMSDNGMSLSKLAGAVLFGALVWHRQHLIFLYVVENFSIFFYFLPIFPVPATPSSTLATPTM